MQILLPTWLGSFEGSGLSLEDYELKVLEKIPENVRRRESECMRNRWFDYARLHPMQATYFFAAVFDKVYRENAKRVFAFDAKYKPEKLDRKLKTFWMLRSLCDLNGWEYEWFVRTMITYRLTTGEFKNRLPQPCHLMKQVDEEVESLKTLWAEQSKDRLLAAIDPWFCVRSWTGHVRQRDHEDFVVAQIKRRVVKHFVIAELVYKRQALRFERAVAEFPSEICQAQKDAAIITMQDR